MKQVLLSISLLFSSVMALHAAKGDMEFRHFTAEDGLSKNTVLAIAQDARGNIWIGTQNGLNVYDGYGFTTYFADPTDPAALYDNEILSLSSGSDGNLWIGTASGLSFYSFEEARFYNYPLHGEVNIYNILEAEGRMMIATDQGLLFFDPQHHDYTEGPSFGDGHVRSLCAGDGRYLVTTDQGLFTLSRDGEVVEIPAFKGMDIYAVASGGGGTGWWVGSYGKGVFRTDGRFEIIKHYRKENSSLPSDFIRTMAMDGYGRLWVGTYDGLAVYEDVVGDFVPYTHGDSPTSISHNSVRAIFSDNQKGVWIGTWFGGVNYWHRQADKVKKISIIGENVYGFISCITQDTETQDLWVGTNDDGLFRYDPASGETGHLELPGAAENIKCVVPGSDGFLYVGTHLGGLLRVDRRTGAFRTWQVNTETPIYNSCYSLLEDSPGQWWVGTLAGLLHLESRTGKIEQHPVALMEPALSHTLVSCLLKDNKGRVWVGTESCLYMVPPSREEVLVFNDVIPGVEHSDFYVGCILQDKAGTIWAATSRGLLRYDEAGRFSSYTRRDGLPNDYVCALLDDEAGHLWISTSSGICRMDPDNGAFRKAGRFGNSEFTVGAGCAGKDGWFNFGGLGGITRFRPFDMFSNPFSPQPYISAVDIQSGDGGRLRRDAAGNIVEVDLPPGANMLTISWSVVNPLSYGENLFSYVLEGFDATSYETRSRQVSYSNLAPGRYRFLLNAANSEARWCKDDVALTLLVRPWWWQTRWARALWLLLALLGAGAVTWLIVSRIEVGMALKVEKAEREQVESNLSQTRDLLMHRFSTEEAKEVLSADEEFLHRAVQVVEENIDNEAFSSSDFAEAMCMSRSNLYLRITNLTGGSASQFIRKIRFQKACQLLSEHKYSIAEISTMVGFSSPSYFATSFKKHVGCLPTEYGKGQTA